MEWFAKSITKEGWVDQMEHAGFKARLMRAQRLQDRGGVHGLPSGRSIPIFPIAALPGAPEGWVREAGTYVCPVSTEWGLWFDWTNNDSLNTAVLPSVKGMNPITGQKIDGFGLEEYSDKCPIHGTPFSHGTLCEECGYAWPPQNHVSYPNTLWWDGFRQPDGKVRQFFFTDDDERDVASKVIGKENTVPAFGFAFYRTKNPRTPSPRTSSFALFSDSQQTYGYSVMDSVMDMDEGQESAAYCSQPILISSRGSISTRKMMASAQKQSKSVSVGAGAQIRQELDRDSLGIDGWQDQPAAVIRLYFAFEEQFKQIVENGGVTKGCPYAMEHLLKGQE